MTPAAILFRHEWQRATWAGRVAFMAGAIILVLLVLAAGAAMILGVGYGLGYLVRVFLLGAGWRP